MSADVAGGVIDLIFGRWRSQILYAGAHLGVFDQLSATEARSAEATAAALGTDPTMTYRLLRALGSLGCWRKMRRMDSASLKVGHCFVRIIPTPSARWRCWKRGRSTTPCGSISRR
jgi:hypothetical protein